MSMLDIKSFTRTPVEKLKKMKIGDRMELLTYKRDRKVLIVKMGEEIYDVFEDGFETVNFISIENAHLAKLLKQLQRIEFPRSNKYFLEISSAPKS